MVEAPQDTLPRTGYEKEKPSATEKEYALGGNLRFPWIQSSELAPDDFHSASVSPWTNQYPVPLCRDPRAIL